MKMFIYTILTLFTIQAIYCQDSSMVMMANSMILPSEMSSSYDMNMTATQMLVNATMSTNMTMTNNTQGMNYTQNTQGMNYTQTMNYTGATPMVNVNASVSASVNMTYPTNTSTSTPVMMATSSSSAATAPLTTVIQGVQTTSVQPPAAATTTQVIVPAQSSSTAPTSSVAIISLVDIMNRCGEYCCPNDEKAPSFVGLQYNLTEKCIELTPGPTCPYNVTGILTGCDHICHHCSGGIIRASLAVLLIALYSLYTNLR